MNRRSLLQIGSSCAIGIGLGFAISPRARRTPEEQDEEQDSLEDQVRVLEHDFLVFGESPGGEAIANVSGYLVNRTENAIGSVVVLVEFIDGDGNKLIYETDEFAPLEPQERTEFTVPLPALEGSGLIDRVEQYEMSILSGVSEIDADQYEYDPREPGSPDHVTSGSSD